MSKQIDRRLTAIEERVKEGQSGTFFFSIEETASGEARYVSQTSGRAYTAEEVLALATEHPDAVVVLPIGAGAPTPGFDDETTEEDLQLHNAYTGRLYDIARATGKTPEEVEASLDDPELLAMKERVDTLRRRWEEHEERVRQYEERIRPWSEEMRRRLDRINGRVPKGGDGE